MAQHLRVLLRRSISALSVFLLVAATATADPVIWTGSSTSFSKDGSANPTLASSQDRLTNNVWLTRGSTQGLYNIAPNHETGFTHFSSPADTEWATDIMSENIGKNITATNYQDLAFTVWETAYGASGLLKDNIKTHIGVVHLITDDIYFNVQFTNWESFGNFTYIRATPSDGDYNGNHSVDIADYVGWRKTLNQASAPFDSADGNANGTIDTNDYAFWRERFGTSPASFSAGSGLEDASVPEPSTATLLVAWLLFLRRRQRVTANA